MSADNNNAVIKVGSSANGVIDDINHNFRVVTERIKNLNLSISYMDLLRLETIFDFGTNTTESNDDRVRRFVANCWNTLPNYTAVAFTGSALSDDYLVHFLGNDITSRDFLVKLPDSQSLFIKGIEAITYTPTSYDVASSQILYTATLSPSAGTTASFVAAMPVGNSTVLNWTAGTVAPTNNLISSRWFLNNEEILWAGSQCTTTPAASVPTTGLTGLLIYHN